VPIRTTIPILVAERLFDIAALALIGVVTAGNLLGIVVMGAVVVVVWGLIWFARSSVASAPPGFSVVSLLLRGRVIGQAMLLSLVAWIPAALTVTLASAALGQHVSILSGMGVFVSSTLLGGFSLMPAGVGVTGSVAILRLQDLGLALPASVAVASLVRLSTAGITLVVGAAFLAVELSRRQAPPGPDSVQHFEEIADEYQQQFAPHIWQLLVEKKTSMIAEALSGASRQVTGLDLGCGHGHHRRALELSGFQVFGMDPAVDSVVYARRSGADVLCGSGTQMPFKDGSLDFVYAIGVIHHLDRDTDRLLAFREIHRVLKPGGLFLLHETNPANLLFRIYMGYIFPILKSIDEGTEQWIDPRQLEVDGFHLDGIAYSTFIPDFTPAPLIKPLSSLERRLESSRWNIYAAHYFAKFVKT
jgi:SAM-dependent methyltransferase